MFHYLFYFARSRINNSHIFIFARRHQFRTVPIPRSAVYNIRMAVDLYHHFAGAHIPNDHLIVRTWRGAGGKQTHHSILENTNVIVF